MHRLLTQTVSISALAASLLATGCRVHTDKDNGSDNVKIATPFGNLQVKTDDANVQASVGLPPYPGAEAVKKGEGDNNGSADVSMNFGSFHMRVKSLSYRSSDSPDKVRAFYTDALRHRYGDLITCQHDKAVGTPTRTPEGLTCSSKGNTRGVIFIESKEGPIELKSGSEQHQHVVSIEHEGSGTKFGLVALDLPGQFTGDSKDADGGDSKQ